MKGYLIFILLIFVAIASTLAQKTTGIVTGVVTSENQPVAGANVVLPDLQKGTATDSEGQFTITNLDAGSYFLSVSSVGYETFEQEITLAPADTLWLEINLESKPAELDEVVVTGTMRETFVRESPVKVNVVSRNYLEKTTANNLMESINFLGGMYEQVSCAVCETSSIRINGMDGPYTAVLIDGMPIMGALASVYGLDGINSNMIRSIEIIKGPNSTLYGSEAMGGVVNVITQDINENSGISFGASMSTHEEANVDFTYTPATDKAETMLGINALYFDRFLDHNDDGFADATRRKRLSLFNKWNFQRDDARKFEVAYKIYLEDRVGGTEGFSRNLRGSDQIYGEAISTRRFELLSTYDLPFETEEVRADFSYSYHDQDSYYGDYHYQANQQIFFTNLIWDKQFNPWRQLLVGATSRLDALDQIFDDIRLAEGSRDTRFIPGLFAQYEHTFTSSFKTLGGMRIDHYKDHGLIYSPRINAKLDLSDHTTFRINGGTGFRIVNLFTEEHEALTGSREVIIEEELDPERSVNGTINLNQIIDIGYSVLNVDLDLFYTHFYNQIIPNYEQINEIRYQNLEGYSVSRGISLSAAHNFIAPFTYSIGVSWMDVFQMNNEIKAAIPFAPEWSGVFTASYTLPDAKTTLDYSGRLVGKMALPEYPRFSNHSELFTEHNLKISHDLSEALKISISVQNIGNYTQKNAIVAPDRPFSDDFETDRVYGPLQTRRAVIGFTMDL